MNRIIRKVIEIVGACLLAIFVYGLIFLLLRAVFPFLLILTFIGLSLFLLGRVIDRWKRPYYFLSSNGLSTRLLREIAWCKRTGKNFDTVEEIIRFNLEEVTSQTMQSLHDWVVKKLSTRSMSVRTKVASDLIDLGDLFKSLSFGDQGLNQIYAILAYVLASTVFNSDSFPKDYASIQGRIGIVLNQYRFLSAHDDTLYFLNRKTQRTALLKSGIFNQMRSPWPEDLKRVALEHCEQSLNALSGEENFADWINSLIALGDIKTSLRDRSAIRHYETALSVINRNQMPNFWADIQMGIGDYYVSFSEPEDRNAERSAISHYREVVTQYYCENHVDKWSHAQVGMSRIFLRSGRDAEAVDCLSQAFETLLSQQEIVTCIPIGKQLVEILFKQSDYRTAIGVCKSLIAAIGDSYKSITSSSLREEVILSSLPVRRILILSQIRTQQLERAIESIESSYARNLNELLTIKSFDSRLEGLSEYLQKSQEQNRAVEEHVSGGTATYENGASGSHFFDGTSHLSEVGKKMIYEKQRQFSYEGGTRNSRVAKEMDLGSNLSFENIQEVITEPSSMALLFYQDRKDTYVFGIPKTGKVNLHCILGENIQGWLEENWIELYQRSHNEWGKRFEALLLELSKKLKLSELIASIPQEVKELILVPSQYLHIIPFSALPFFSDKNVVYLCEKYALRSVTSFRLIEICNQRSGENRSEPVRDLSACLGIIENATNDLAFSTFECEKISRMLQIPDIHRLRGKKQASVEKVQSLIGDSKIKALHFSHHAYSRIDNPLESCIVLAEERIDIGRMSQMYPREIPLAQILTDQKWRMTYEIGGHSRISEVFLACCETQLSKIDASNNVLTLGTGFLVAGANRVICSFWKVDDLSTAFLSIFYYEEHSRGHSCSESLRKAQLRLKGVTGEQLRNLIDENFLGQLPDETRSGVEILYSQAYPFQSPINWAAFACFG